VDVLNPVESARKRTVFFRNIFDVNEGYVCIAYGTKDRSAFREEFFRYPQDLDAMNDLIDKVYMNHNVWFCAQLLNGKRRKKENVSVTPCAWSDLDACDYHEMLVDPTFVLESSPGRYQAFWSFNEDVIPEDAEDLSRRIAYTHADHGADRSGWDLTQLVRVPFTYNHKYASTPVVRVVIAGKNKYSANDIKNAYSATPGFTYEDVPLPLEDDLPQDVEELLQANRLKMNPMIWKLFQDTPEKDWSGYLWRLEMLLFEAGFPREHVYAICRKAACNKYDRDGKGNVFLWKEVLRAESKHDQNTNIIVPKDFIDAPLVTEEERRQLASEETFIERYIAWAKSLGDAAPQYHQAGAFIALSSLLAGNVRLPTSFGMILPNLWFMILADTTLTRKSTAMDISMDLVAEVDADAIMATDGSLEGLLTALSSRPGRPSVFLRDEFSGLLEAMTKKDYMAGMPELFTKLYDGKMQKRILRKETIEVKQPVLILFAGGIRSKITSLLSFEHVSSGFMPRFVFITAESDVTRIKPLGPPTQVIDDTRSLIFDELSDLKKHYNKTTIMQITGSPLTIEQQSHFDATLTPEAWHRYNVMETQMLEAGMQSARPEMMTPVYDRLAKSMLKSAVLLAASEQRNDTVIVEEKHMVRAMLYGESWRMYARDVMSSVGQSTNERRLDLIYKAICSRPGISRSTIMQNYHCDSREMESIATTLEQRSLITRQRQGKGQIFYPMIMN
jgi:uncharacterized protein DUF3987/DNA primase RepB-like protein